MDCIFHPIPFKRLLLPTKDIWINASIVSGLKRMVFLLVLWLLGIGLVRAQETWVLSSTYLNKPDTVWVFTPKNIPGPYPTVVLLHGYGGNHRQWNKLLGLQQLANESGFQYVCPSDNQTWYLATKQSSGNDFPAFFFRDFLPALLAKWAVRHDALFIDGLSMGGHGALYLFLQQPELFRAAGSMSGVLDLQYSGQRNYSLKQLLGSYDSLAWKPHTAYHRLNAEKALGKPLIVDCGRQDFLLECNRRFARRAAELGYSLSYVEHEGGHEHSYWKGNFYLHLAFFRHLLNH